MGPWTYLKWILGTPARVFWYFWSPVDVLVLGSAHIDTMGEVVGGSFATGCDHEGRIVYAVGGSGYNVAVNIAAAGNNRRVALNTLLPLQSKLADVVLAKLSQQGVTTNHVRRLSIKRGDAEDFSHSAMGGQVSIRSNGGATVSSVSKTLVSTPNFWPRRRDALALTRAWAVVVDTYLLETAARDIAQRASERGLPLFVCATADSAAQRFAKNIAQSDLLKEAVHCIAGNAAAIDAMARQIDPDIDRSAARSVVLHAHAARIDERAAMEVCRTLQARYVASINDFRVVILGQDGAWKLLDLRDLKEGAKNQVGDGDAVVAGVVDVFVSLAKQSGSRAHTTLPDLTDEATIEKLEVELKNHVRRAVSSYGPTPGSVISFEEPFETFWRIVERWGKYVFDKGLNLFAWLGLLVASDWLLRLVFGFHVVIPSLKKLSAGLGVLTKLLKISLGPLFGH